MRVKMLKLVIPALLSVISLSGCGNSVPSGYYADYDLTLEGPALEEELQRLCFETHKVYVKYSQFKANATSTKDHVSCDVSPSTAKKSYDKQKNEYFYTGKVAKGIGTREHVWPCANSGNLWVHDSGAGTHYVDGTNYKGGGSDLYHVRPSSSIVNTARGNSKYVDFADEEFDAIRNGVTEVGDGGPYTLKVQGGSHDEQGNTAFSVKAEPADEFKGDIARIIVYIWIHYAYRGHDYKAGNKSAADMMGQLKLTEVFGYGDNLTRVQEKLCEWNELDPVSETEKLRNTNVQKVQGNRNPFVDYPELMGQLFGM